MTKRIFAAAEPLEEKITKRLAEDKAERHENPGHYAPPKIADTYRSLYADALKRLDQHDILTLESAAELMDLTPDAYLRKADRGQAVLIEFLRAALHTQYAL